MKSKNIVFMPAVVIPGLESRSIPYKYGIESWKRWCAKNDAELVVMDQLLCPAEEMKITWQRYYAMDVLENSGIDYEQVLITDADCIIHPDTPNFFYMTEGKYTVARAIGSMDWICRSMENYSKHMFNNNTFDIFKYFCGGFQITNKSQKHIWKGYIEYYLNNKEMIQQMQKTFGVGTDQPIINHLTHSSKEELTYLPYEYCAVDLHRFEILDKELTFTDCFPGIYQFNAIPDNHDARWTNYFMEQTFKKLYGNI
jgi:hypothetical protein